MAAGRYWGNGNLAAEIAQAITDARNAYDQQFAPRKVKIGFMGSTHDKNKAGNRLAALSLSLNQATTDTQRLQAVRDVPNDTHSYKAGSLKLCLVRALWTRLAPAVPTNITPQNAQLEGHRLLNGIEQGTY